VGGAAVSDMVVAALQNPPLPNTRRPMRAVALQFLRLGMFASIISLIHLRHQEFEARRLAHGLAAVSIESVQALFPTAARLAEGDQTRAAQSVLDRDSVLLGYVVQSSPQSDRVVGFSGTTNVLIGFDERERVVGLRILASRDTREHIAHVERDARFLSQWNGQSWDQAARHSRVDTVSGATLTSLAIVEGVTLRLGGQRPTLRFPNALRLAEIAPFLPAAASLQTRTEQPAVVDVLDARDITIGFAVRTTPAADAVIGYQGPSDTLLVFVEASKLVGLSVRQSYDNEPYVGYVRDEASFAGHFIDRGYQELSRLDPQAEGIEGVSGATMTSMSVARSIAPALQAAEASLVATSWNGSWSRRDLGTMFVLLLAALTSMTRLRGVRLWRVVFQLTLVGYLGFVNGDLLSQASLVGWAQAGIPWRTAPGLTLLTLAAVLVPACSRTQLYCHQVCPFGAAQQLLLHGRNRRPRSRQHAAASTARRSLLAVTKAAPAVLLIVVVSSAMGRWPVSLVALEPFDAFHVTIAGAATLTIAVIGLVVSAVVPMAYCRFGCPTGAMLNFLRFHARSDCWSARDSLAVGLLTMALLMR